MLCDRVIAYEILYSKKYSVHCRLLRYLLMQFGWVFYQIRMTDLLSVSLAETPINLTFEG
jgi:hypothetical protein